MACGGYLIVPRSRYKPTSKKRSCDHSPSAHHAARRGETPGSASWPWATATRERRPSPREAVLRARLLESFGHPDLAGKLRDRGESSFAVGMDAEAGQSSGCGREIQGRHELLGSGCYAHGPGLTCCEKCCRRAGPARSSRTNRSETIANASLIATRRSMRGSRALCTSPMPPPRSTHRSTGLARS